MVYDRSQHTKPACHGICVGSLRPAEGVFRMKISPTDDEDINLRIVKMLLTDDEDVPYGL